MKIFFGIVNTVLVIALCVIIYFIYDAHQSMKRIEATVETHMNEVRQMDDRLKEKAIDMKEKTLNYFKSNDRH